MTVNSWGADEPAQATKGGTGLNSYATGDIIYASGANTWAKLAAGTNGHVLKLNSGVPAWEAESGGGGAWTWLANGTASDSSSVVFDSTYITSTYDTYAILFHNVRPVSDGDLIMRFSPDNGSTIRTSGYDAEAFQMEGTGTTTVTDGIDFQLNSVGGGSDEGRVVGMALVCNAADSGIKTHVAIWDGYINSSNGRNFGFGYGKYDTAETHNYIQIIANSSNIQTGNFYLYGLANS